MKDSLKHDLILALLTGVIAVNTLTSIRYHTPSIYQPVPYVQTTDIMNMTEDCVETSAFFQRMQDQTVMIECYNQAGRLVGTGSGVILDAMKGLIMTAEHVTSIQGTYTIKLRTTSGYIIDSYLAETIIEDAGILEGLHDFIFPKKTPQNDPLDMEEKLRDEKREQEKKKPSKKEQKDTYGPDIRKFRMQDIAFLKFNRPIPGTSARFATVEPVVGDPVYVVGSPYGPDFFNTVSKGILSGINRIHYRLRSLRVYQTDAAILPGNSGGPWFNSNGEIIAISTSWIPQSGTVGFGIPLPELTRLLKKV